MGGLAGGGISLGTLSVAITATVDEALRALQGFGNDVGELVEDQKKKWDGLASVGQSMTTLGTSLTAALTVPIAGIGAAAVSAASDFEASLNKITAVSGTTGAELESLRGLALKLGADTKFSAQEAAEGMGNLAAAGFKTNEIMAAMPGTLDLAAAGTLSVERAAEVTAETLGQFQLNADQAGRVANVFAKGAAASAISVEQMAQSMKYAGPVAQSAGYSMEQMATATALLGNAGIKGEQAGTSLRGMIASLVSPSKAAAEELERLGVKTTDAAGKMLPLDQIFQQLKASGAGTAEMFKIFDNASASAAATLTANAGPAWAGMTKEITNSEGAAKAMAETLNTGLKGAWEQMKGSLDTVLIALGTSLLPIMTKLIQVGTQFINDWILPAVQAFGKLDPTLQTIIIALAGLAAGIGPVIFVAGEMVIAFTAIMPVLTTLGAGIATFVGGLSAPVIAIAAVTAALVAFGVWVYANWDDIVAFLSGAWDTIKETWTNVWDGIVAAVKAVWEAFTTPIAAYWQFVTDLVGAVWNVITAIWEAEWKAIVAVVTAVWDAIEPYVRAVFGPIIEFLQSLWDNIKTGWDAVWGGIKTIVTGVWNALDRAASAVLKPVATFLGGIWDDLKRVWNAVWGGLKSSILGIWDDIKWAVGKFTDALGTIKTVVTGIPGKLNSVANAIRGVGTEADKAAGHSPVPEFNDALTDMIDAAIPLPPKLDPCAASIAALGEAAGLAHPKLVFPEFSAIQTGATNATAPLNTFTAGITGLGTEATTAKPALDFGMLWSNIVTGATNATGGVVGLKTSVNTLKTDGSADFGSFASAAGAACTGIGTSVGNLVTSVGSAINSFASDLTSSLWEGEGSWGEKGKKLLGSLGQSVMDAFVTPAKTALNDLITGVIADLLGGKGFGGILEGIKGIGSAIGGIFGGGGGAGGGLGGILGGIGGKPGGGGAGGGLGGIMGGAGGWISGIGSAISGALSFIGSMRTEGTLNAIEKEVRYSQIHLFYILSDLNDFFHRDWWVLYGLVLDIKSAIVDSMEPQLARAAQHIDVLKQIAENDLKVSLGAIASYTLGIQADANHAAIVLGQILLESQASNARLDKMIATSERIAAASERSVNMNLYGTDPEIVAARIAQQLRMQGGNG